jgi:hypothetical protein
MKVLASWTGKSGWNAKASSKEVCRVTGCGGCQRQPKDNPKGTTQATKTDRDGVYRFFFLAPGRYTVMSTHDDFRDESRAMNVLLGLRAR